MFESQEVVVYDPFTFNDILGRKIILNQEYLRTLDNFLSKRKICFVEGRQQAKAELDRLSVLDNPEKFALRFHSVDMENIHAVLHDLRRDGYVIKARVTFTPKGLLALKHSLALYRRERFKIFPRLNVEPYKQTYTLNGIAAFNIAYG